jgi:hypothetical protein
MARCAARSTEISGAYNRGQGNRFDQHRYDPPRGSRLPSEGRAQLRAPVRGGEVGFGAHRQQPVRPLERLLHAGHEVLTRRPVPHVQLGAVAGLLEPGPRQSGEVAG